MSNSLSALMSATFYERGYDHHIEVIHQRDAEARRRLESLEVTLYDGAGALLATPKVDPSQDILDLGALVADATRASERVMVVLDARYDEAIFPYRPHHYAYLHRAGSTAPPLYYAINAVLGGVPDRVGATAPPAAVSTSLRPLRAEPLSVRLITLPAPGVTGRPPVPRSDSRSGGSPARRGGRRARGRDWRGQHRAGAVDLGGRGAGGGDGAGRGGDEDEPAPPDRPAQRRPDLGEPGQLPLPTGFVPRLSCQPRAPAVTAERA